MNYQILEGNSTKAFVLLFIETIYNYTADLTYLQNPPSSGLTDSVTDIDLFSFQFKTRYTFEQKMESAIDQFYREHD